MPQIHWPQIHWPKQVTGQHAFKGREEVPFLESYHREWRVDSGAFLPSVHQQVGIAIVRPNFRMKAAGLRLVQ